jgi:hypothetical protein
MAPRSLSASTQHPSSLVGLRSPVWPIGSDGDSYHNALAETIDGLLKAEVIGAEYPMRRAKCRLLVSFSCPSRRPECGHPVCKALTWRPRGAYRCDEWDRILRIAERAKMKPNAGRDPDRIGAEV